MKTLFKLFRWIFRGYLDDYIFDRTIKDPDPNFTQKQKEYLMVLAKDDRLDGILDVFVASVVATGMAANSKSSIQQRQNWIECYGYIKDVMRKYKEQAIQQEKAKKINPLTNEPFKSKGKK